MSAATIVFQAHIFYNINLNSMIIVKAFPSTFEPFSSLIHSLTQLLLPTVKQCLHQYSTLQLEVLSIFLTCLLLFF
ncbi:hypothetical protein CANARDRAFT_26430 [[Candida] arabinofermentans NRRL YB-2248]|uniref:Uncharacterized protein n=1 Tax=[Candida] arabinofermentans NRRL YB-2248 TaxID=983967 RepID=A0A1E4T968_9ASCO|nr:hypothetical protein CANARDRAFT_26430 [[Candida] arabinofermentans NRRL YB-2248]